MGNMQKKTHKILRKNSKNEWEVLCRMIQENYRIISLSLLFFYRILLFFLVCYRIVKDLGIIKVFVNVIIGNVYQWKDYILSQSAVPCRIKEDPAKASWILEGSWRQFNILDAW